jgi:hypothetical protein
MGTVELVENGGDKVLSIVSNKFEKYYFATVRLHYFCPSGRLDPATQDGASVGHTALTRRTSELGDSMTLVVARQHANSPVRPNP